MAELKQLVTGAISAKKVWAVFQDIPLNQSAEFNCQTEILSINTNNIYYHYS